MGKVQPMVSAPLVVPEAPDAADAAAVLAAGSRSFHFASLFLPGGSRADAALLYSFCRYVDDVADDAPDADMAREALARLRAELLGQAAPRPFLASILALFVRRHIDVQAAIELIEGVDTDLDEVRVASDAELVQYGYRVAGTVGLMMCGVLDVADVEAPPHAVDLGIGMQITNICRDVKEDALRGRVYLPATRLKAQGIEATPEAVLAHPQAVSVVVRDLLSLADRYYASAEDGMRFIPWRARGAILVAARVYHAIGTRLLRHGANPLAGRTVVPGWRKGLIALGALGSFPGLTRRRGSHRALLHQAIAGWPGANPTTQRV